MANNLDIGIDKSVLDLITKGTALTVTTPVMLKLMTANGTNTTNGTEVTGSAGYTTGGLTTAAAWAAAANVSGQGSVTTTTALTWTNMPSCTVVGVELWDSAGTPKRLAFGALTTPQVVASGNTFTISTGQLTITLA